MGKLNITIDPNIFFSGTIKVRMVVKKVIFNDPATIVFWDDNTKTVVKCQPEDVYDKRMGLALCIAKKALGNKGNYNKVFDKWIPEEKELEQKMKLKYKVGDKVRIGHLGTNVVLVGTIMRIDEDIYVGVPNCHYCISVDTKRIWVFESEQEAEEITTNGFYIEGLVDG